MNMAKNTVKTAPVVVAAPVVKVNTGRDAFGYRLSAPRCRVIFNVFCRLTAERPDDFFSTNEIQLLVPTVCKAIYGDGADATIIGAVRNHLMNFCLKGVAERSADGKAFRMTAGGRALAAATLALYGAKPVVVKKQPKAKK